MSETNTVLVGVANPRTAEYLVRIGVELARAKAARLIVVSIVLVTPGSSLSHGAREARAQRRLLRKAAQIANEEGVQADTIVRAGHTIDEALADVVIETDASLLVVGWAPTSRFGNVAESPMWRLTQQPPCDMLSVKPFDPRARPQRILLPLRGGTHADLAASLGISLAQAWGASVTLLRVIPTYLPDAEAQAEDQAFREYWEGRYPGLAHARSVVAPQLLECLVSEAAGHDLIVMGAAATARSFPYPYGNLAEEIARRVECPILITKTERQMPIAEYGPVTIVDADRHAGVAESVSPSSTSGSRRTRSTARNSPRSRTSSN